MISEKPVGGTTAPIDLATLCAQAAQALRPMFDFDRQLFCQKLIHTETGFVRYGHSPRYTMMTLLGLHRAALSGLTHSFDTRKILDRLIEDLPELKSLGDIGLLLWTCAELSPERLESVWATCRLKGKYAQFQAVREGNTMELAWLLSGMAHMRMARQDQFEGMTGLAEQTKRLLRKNQGSQGVFGHLGSGTAKGWLRGRIGSFADQVYPTYAFSLASRAFGWQPELESARRCADALCRTQGELGQWWWHYDAHTGLVVERYPVYSVHQEAMGPMALFALMEAGNLDYSEPIWRGLNWIAGTNELGCDMRDRSGVVWRSAYFASPLQAHLERFQILIGRARRDAAAHLKVLHECWPYELGWLLFAFSGRDIRFGKTLSFRANF